MSERSSEEDPSIGDDSDGGGINAVVAKTTSIVRTNDINRVLVDKAQEENNDKKTSIEMIEKNEKLISPREKPMSPREKLMSPRETPAMDPDSIIQINVERIRNIEISNDI